MNPELGADYELLAAVAQVVQVLAWIAILVGAFLRESGTREYLSKGAEGLGWVALIGSGIVGSQIAAQQANANLPPVDHLPGPATLDVASDGIHAPSPRWCKRCVELEGWGRRWFPDAARCSGVGESRLSRGLVLRARRGLSRQGDRAAACDIACVDMKGR